MFLFLKQIFFVIDAGFNLRNIKHYKTLVKSSKSGLADTGYRSYEINKSFDEARLNLAKHVMSNGVELIIASDKIKRSDQHAGSLSSEIKKRPMTLAPSTLMNHMILVVPTLNEV